MLALAQGIVGNNPPVVNRSVFSQSAALGFSQTGNAFNLAANTYTDTDPGDSINYSIALANFSALSSSAFTWKPISMAVPTANQLPVQVSRKFLCLPG